MPIVAVAGAVAGASALAAGGLTVFGTISAIGGIIGGIGAITGNDDMMKIGAVAGLAGGVGAFASGQGWISGGGANNVINGDAGTGSIQQSLNATAPGLESGAVNNPSAYTAPSSSPLAETGNLDAGSISQSIGQPTGLMDAANRTDMRLQSGTQTSPLSSQPSPLAGSPSQNPLTDVTRPAVPTGGTTPQTPTTTGGGILSTLKSLGSFMDQNKQLSSIAANFVGGMFDERKAAETDLLKARAETERQRLLNASAVPQLNIQNKSKGPLFKPGTPTYNAPRPTSLFYA